MQSFEKNSPGSDLVELITGQSRNLAECNFNGNFSDRFLAEVLEKIDKGIAEL